MIGDDVEAGIAQWRAAITRGRVIDAADADELESHLREQVADLGDAGLSEDEAFLIAVKRMGQVDRLTAEFAREHGERLWKQLTPVPASTESGRDGSWIAMLLFAGIAVVLVQAARILAGAVTSSSEPAAWFLRDLGLFVLPVLAGYFAWRRRIGVRRSVVLLAIVVAIAVAIDLYPVPAESAAEVLIAIHLPVVLWFVVGVAYLGGRRSVDSWMDFVRFTGEWVVYYALIALGGAVLFGLTTLVLAPIVPGAIDGVTLWVLPSGAAGAVLVAAWLVEAKKSVIENIAPVLTMIFTPLFAVMLLVAAVIYGVTGIGRDFDRDLLTVFDLLLIIVVGLVLFGLSVRNGRPGAMDVIRLVAVACAIVLDALVLASMLARIGEFGFTANRVAALGLNLLLVVDLVVTAGLGISAIRRRSLARMERWQTLFLPVFGVWAAIVVLVLPPVFGFA